MTVQIEEWTAADAALARLRAAFLAAGIIVPSLRVDLASAVAGTPLIELGRINLATAEQLAAALGDASIPGRRP